MPIYEYVCENEHVTERLVGFGVEGPQPCQACGLTAERQEVYRILPFTDSGVKIGRINEVPLDQRCIKVSKFKEAAQELEYNHAKNEETVQHKLDHPDYAKIGITKANLVAAGKAPPPKEKF